MSSTLRIAVAVLVAVLAALAGMWLAQGRTPQRLELEHATAFPVPRPLPDFGLVDQHGQPFDRDDLRGRWNILFFGFTHCPDVCPSTLATLAAARRELAGLPTTQQPGVVLVSIDPQRDTPERLAEYVAFFDPSFTALTGEPKALQDLTRDLGVAVLVSQPDASGHYTIDHTATLFLINPDGALAAVFGTPHTPDGIAHDYRLVTEHAARNR